MRMRGIAGAVLAALLGLAALLAPSAGAEASPSAYADRLVTLINQARADNGLRALTVTSGTSTVAANWTRHLDGQQQLSHNPDLGPQLETHGSPNWTAYGENVGEGSASSADQVFKAYMNSPEHRDNILNVHYRYLGVGVVFDNSVAWNTLDFVDQYSTSKPRTAPQPATKTTAPSASVSAAPKATPQRAVRLPHTASGSVRPAVHRPAVHAVARAAATPATPLMPVASPRALPVASPLAAAVPAPLDVPAHLPGRDTAPFAAAAAMILLVVSTRYVVEVFPRRA